MRIVDGIAYAEEPTQPVKIESARPLDGWRLRLRFSTGEVKIFDFAPLLNAPCFKPLQDESLFRSVSLDHGVPVWLDGEIDIAPEKLWQDGFPEETAACQVEPTELPFTLRVPNAETQAAMKEADEIARNHRTRFRSAEELFRQP